ncbi:MAG TPA: YihY/virulence factor BrkB family protein [Gaiellaceae bacterium]|nr:YihY/virulence factor BrkB family protein [Gaiellaceae bacterium]
MGASPSSTGTDTPDIGHVPSGPEQLSLRDWIDSFKRAFREFMADDCLGLAQQIAFSSLLAFFPAMILLVGLLGLIDAYEDLKEFVGVVAPGAVIDAIDLAQQSAAGRDTAAVAVLFGAFGAVWVASGAMNAVVKALNAAYDRMETRPFWKVRLTAIVLVLASGFATAGMFLLIVFGGPLGEAIASEARLGGAFELFWAILRWPLAFVAILLFFALVYYAAPNVDQRHWKWVTPGSLVGGVLWLALSGLFALYTSFSESYDKTYGSLAGGIILLLWLNYSAVALLFGAELNAELDRQAGIRAAGGEDAGLVRTARRAR